MDAVHILAAEKRYWPVICKADRRVVGVGTAGALDSEERLPWVVRLAPKLDEEVLDRLVGKALASPEKIRSARCLKLVEHGLPSNERRSRLRLRRRDTVLLREILRAIAGHPLHARRDRGV